jgi:tRNA A37 N6-isopentenylltransferase MiaA
MRAIGVPEIAAFLRGESDAESAIAAGQQATRNYVKRQFTWLNTRIRRNGRAMRTKITLTERYSRIISNIAA